MRIIRFHLILAVAYLASGTSLTQAEENPLNFLFPAKEEAEKPKSKESPKKAPAMKKEEAAKKDAPKKTAVAMTMPQLNLFPFLAPGGPKRVEVNLTEQRLRAYEGARLVLQTNISSGRGGITPTGNFKAGYKDADHHSSLYHNSPMPWSVQVRGNIFIHGHTEVPDFPASHGCVRVPLTGKNPAKRLFEWIEPGTPIKIHY